MTAKSFVAAAIVPNHPYGIESGCIAVLLPAPFGVPLKHVPRECRRVCNGEPSNIRDATRSMYGISDILPIAHPRLFLSSVRVEETCIKGQGKERKSAIEADRIVEKKCVCFSCYFLCYLKAKSLGYLSKAGLLRGQLIGTSCPKLHAVWWLDPRKDFQKDLETLC